MKRALLMLACSAVLGIYFLEEYPSSKEPAEKTQAMSLADDIQPLPLVVAEPIRPLDLPEEAVTKNEEQALKTVSLGEYIDPLDSSRRTYREPIEVGEYIDPRDRSNSDIYDSVSAGEYIPVDAESGSEAVNLGEFVPVNSESVYRDDRDAVSTGEYVPID